jgi:hypothetical protein
VSWHLQLVVFTSKAFGNGAIHNRIRTVDEINALLASGDVMIVSTPVTFNGAITSKRTYEMGTPVVIPFP